MSGKSDQTYLMGLRLAACHETTFSPAVTAMKPFHPVRVTSVNIRASNPKGAFARERIEPTPRQLHRRTETTVHVPVRRWTRLRAVVDGWHLVHAGGRIASRARRRLGCRALARRCTQAIGIAGPIARLSRCTALCRITRRRQTALGNRHASRHAVGEIAENLWRSDNRGDGAAVLK